MTYQSGIPIRFAKCGSGLLIFLLITLVPTLTAAQSSRSKVDGMWSDPPAPQSARFVSFCVLTLGLSVSMRSWTIRQTTLVRSRNFRTRPESTSGNSSVAAYRCRAETYPVDQADNPSFLRCEPPGLAQQCLCHTNWRSGRAATTESNSATENGRRDGRFISIAASAPPISHPQDGTIGGPLGR